MSIQDYRSGIAAIEPLVYVTDRNNEMREPLEHFDTVQPDWDIDRAGSKGRVEISTYKDVLEDYMWIAPYQRIIPETGDIIEQQLGHFRLDRPSDVADGMMARDGTYKMVQEATGGDIVDDIAAVMLPFTFYTPVQGHPMSDVHFLIKLATMGMIGPNLIENGGFEHGLDGWLQSNSAGAGFVTTGSSQTIPKAEGDIHARFAFNSGLSNGEYLRVYRDVLLPSDAKHILVSGIANSQFVRHEMRADVQWRDDTGAGFGGNVRLQGLSPYRQWRRHFRIISVPSNAFYARVRVGVYTRAGSGATSGVSAWDDIQVRTVSQMPLPDSRISLPLSNDVATTRIQTTVGDSIGYTAINEHRLGAIAHHALFTELDGTLTTAPSRSLANATVARQFGMDDYEMVGDVRTERAARKPYNHFVAVKEDFTGENPTLYAHAYNEDPLDRRSIHHAPLNSAPPIQAPDAVDQAALQALADAARDRESENEVLQMRIRPGEALRPHDVIEITASENPRAIGRWLVEYIRPGMTPDDPLVEIGARRARSQEVS